MTLRGGESCVELGFEGLARKPITRLASGSGDPNELLNEMESQERVIEE
jgi:hypothetical protein